MSQDYKQIIQDLQNKLEQSGSLTIKVRAAPHKPITRIKEVMANGNIKIDIAAPPEGGRANKELSKYFAKLFDIKNTSKHISIVGETSRTKIITIVFH